MNPTVFKLLLGGGSGAVKAAVGAGAVEYAWGKAKQFRRDIGPK